MKIFAGIRISVGTKFQLKLIILTFWTKFSQKKALNTTVEFCIFEVVGPNFDSLGQTCPKRVFPVENKKVNSIIEF